MRYFVDAEYKGFGGPLISLALVPDEQEALPFYEALPCANPKTWFAEHVLPVRQTLPISRPEMTAKLAAYLRGDLEPIMIADWPEDIAHLTLLMVTGPRRRIPSPRLRFELLDVPLFDSETLSDVLHNVRYDAIALRAYVLAQELTVGTAARCRDQMTDMLHTLGSRRRTRAIQIINAALAN